MATAAKPRAPRILTLPPIGVRVNEVETYINRCEVTPAAEIELPDLTFEVTGSIGDVKMSATYCVSAQRAEELESGEADRWYMAMYSDEPREKGSGSRIGIETDASPTDLRLMASLLAALADQVEAELPAHMERVGKARETLKSLCDEW